MAVIDRYPTWVLLVLAVASAAALTGIGAYLDRRSPQTRRFWIRLLAAYLVIVGLGWTGALPSRSGPIPANAALLVIADLMIALLLVLVPAWLWQRRRGTGRHWPYGCSGVQIGVLIGVLVFALICGAFFGEIRLASALPPPPATAACDDYGTWLLAPGNGVPPAADRAVLAKAAREAPAGRLSKDLTALAGDVQITLAAWGTEQGFLDEQQVLNDMSAVTRDCRSVPTQ